MSAKIFGDFWTWSLERYSRNGAAPALLQMQDEFQVNINIMLWLCWGAEYFEKMPDLMIRKAIDQTSALNRNVTQRLRSARDFLKNWQVNNPAQRDDLRKTIKAAELDAEKVEQMLLQDLANKNLSALAIGYRHDEKSRALHNLTAYMAITGASRKNGFTTALLQSLIGHIFD